MTVTFKKSDKKQMNEWLGGNKRYTCLFKATRDGCCATTFHANCNNKGPTITIMYNTNNSVYGGYTSKSWVSTEGYQVDGNSFLFRLHQNGTCKPIKLPVSNTTYSIYDNSTYGPTFGSGHDLPSFSNTVSSSGGYFQFNNGSFNFGHSYSKNGETSDSFTNGHKNIKDIEVYSVEGGQQYITIPVPVSINGNTQLVQLGAADSQQQPQQVTLSQPSAAKKVRK